MVSITSAREVVGVARCPAACRSRASASAHRHGTAGRDRAVVDRLAVGMDGETVGNDQRGAAVRRRGMHGDGDDAAQRQAADVRPVDAQRIHRREDRAAKSSRVAPSTKLAFAIARIVEGDRPPGRAEMVELRRARRSCPIRHRAGTGSAFRAARLPNIRCAPALLRCSPSPASWGARHRFARARLARP